MIFPLVLAGTTGIAAIVQYVRRPKITPERRQLYFTALQKEKDPERLEALAEQFRSYGMLKEAELLAKRANLRRLPDDVKAQRKEIFRKAMRSTNRNAILEVAECFEKDGATGAAFNLRKYASELPPKQ